MQVCDSIILGCDICFEKTIAHNTTMNVMAGLTPASTPYLWVIDKFGNQYRNQITIAGDGSFNILTSLYPDGMFNQYSGIYDVFISSDLLGLVIVQMTFNSKKYNCLKLSITC